MATLSNYLFVTGALLSRLFQLKEASGSNQPLVFVVLSDAQELTFGSDAVISAGPMPWPVASASRPMSPPIASTSRTSCPFASPPIAGREAAWVPPRLETVAG